MGLLSKILNFTIGKQTSTSRPLTPRPSTVDDKHFQDRCIEIYKACPFGKQIMPNEYEAAVLIATFATSKMLHFEMHKDIKDVCLDIDEEKLHLAVLVFRIAGLWYWAESKITGEQSRSNVRACLIYTLCHDSDFAAQSVSPSLVGGADFLRAEMENEKGSPDRLGGFFSQLCGYYLGSSQLELDLIVKAWFTIQCALPMKDLVKNNLDHAG
jgi:hypothetical protein